MVYQLEAYVPEDRLFFDYNVPKKLQEVKFPDHIERQVLGMLQ